MRSRIIEALILVAVTTAWSGPGVTADRPHAAGKRTQASAARHPPSTRHTRQVDVNDVVGHGAWLGCAARNASTSARESASLPAIYCGRAPIVLARAEVAPDAGRAA